MKKRPLLLAIQAGLSGSADNSGPIINLRDIPAVRIMRNAGIFDKPKEAGTVKVRVIGPEQSTPVTGTGIWE